MASGPQQSLPKSIESAGSFPLAPGQGGRDSEASLRSANSLIKAGARGFRSRGILTTTSRKISFRTWRFAALGCAGLLLASCQHEPQANVPAPAPAPSAAVQAAPPAPAAEDRSFATWLVG